MEHANLIFAIMVCICIMLFIIKSMRKKALKNELIIDAVINPAADSDIKMLKSLIKENKEYLKKSIVQTESVANRLDATDARKFRREMGYDGKYIELSTKFVEEVLLKYFVLVSKEPSSFQHVRYLEEFRDETSRILQKFQGEEDVPLSYKGVHRKTICALILYKDSFELLSRVSMTEEPHVIGAAQLLRKMAFEQLHEGSKERDNIKDSVVNEVKEKLNL